MRRRRTALGANLLVADTRRIVGFGIHAGTVDGRALCRMFNHAIRGLSRPKRLSSDHDPLYRFHQWRANLRVLQVTEVKSVPSAQLCRCRIRAVATAWRSFGDAVFLQEFTSRSPPPATPPCTHSCTERLIGTLRRECVDQLLFWSASDLADKLVAFQDFYNAHRAHTRITPGADGTPTRAAGSTCCTVVGRADARPDTKGCRTARPLPMGRALPWSLSDADRGVTPPRRPLTSEQRRRWRAGRRARVRRLSRQSRAVRQLHALLMPSRQLRGGLPAHRTRRSNVAELPVERFVGGILPRLPQVDQRRVNVGFLRIRHPQAGERWQREHRGRALRERRRVAGVLRTFLRPPRGVHGLPAATVHGGRQAA